MEFGPQISAGPPRVMSSGSSPSSAVVVEPQATRSIVEWTPALIKAARIAADAGNLELAADFCEWAIGDDRVSASLATRTNGLVSLPVTFEPARGSRRPVRALEGNEDWWAAYPAETLAQLLSWGRFLGVGLAHQTWVERGDGINRLVPRIKIWHPRNLRRDMRRGVWRVRTANKGEIDITPGDGNWIIFTPYGESRPWAYGAWRPVSYWRLLKQYAIEDWGYYSGKNAGGLTVATNAITDPKALADKKLAEFVSKAMRKELATLMFEAQANASLALPPGWDIKKVESTANTWETFRAQKDAADLANAVSILGQNLSSEVSGPVSTGATLHGKVLHVYIVDDNEKLHTCVREQSLKYWAEFNFGNGSLAPWSSYDVTPPEDQKRKAEVEKVRSDTAKTLSSIGCFTVNEVRIAAGREPFPKGDPRGEELMKASPPPAPKPAEDDEPEDEDEDEDDEDDGAVKPTQRILIAGGPRVGKTTLSRRLSAELGVRVHHTDDLIATNDWSSASDAVAQWMNAEGPWIIEGVAVVRGLRKWLAANPEGLPFDTLYWSSTPREDLNDGQQTMTKGCETVLEEIRGELTRRGANIRSF